MPSTKPGNSSTPRQPCATIGRKRISSCPQRCCPLQSGTWIWLSFAEPASSGTQSECSPAAARVAHRHREKLGIALNKKAQHRLEALALVRRDERRARDGDALGDRDA